jgi:hypothetical protein
MARSGATIHGTLSPQQRAAQLAEDEVNTRRHKRRVLLRAFALGLLAEATGIYAMAYAVHSTDAKTGRVVFYGGLFFADVVVFAIIVWTYSRYVDEGWL